MVELKGTKYEIKFTTKFQKSYKKLLKSGIDEDDFKHVVNLLANGDKLSFKYRNHKLVDSKYYKNCYECHIKPDWLLIYEYLENELILLLVDTGSHSNLF